MSMFQGASALTLDAKGRLVIPSRHRNALLSENINQIILTAHPHGCLLLFSASSWEAQRGRIAEFPVSAIGWKRILLGYATEQDIETTGRVLISPELRRFAKLEKEVMMLGQGTYFEIWDAVAWRQMELETMAQGVPSGLENFSL